MKAIGVALAGSVADGNNSFNVFSPRAWRTALKELDRALEAFAPTTASRAMPTLTYNARELAKS